ncbi:SIMPL domain-containing protein [Cohaesibacter celericrescens]|nr:SIMPL domain-containing protein [Cohaesibacter celericrescens]
MRKHLLILAALVPMIMTPAMADETKGGSISVVGMGIVEMAPDMAIVSAGVQSRSETAQAALAANNASMKALFDELEKAGIEKKDIQTANFNINPEIVYPKTNKQAPQIVGYIVNNQVSVNIRKLENVGSVLTALVDAGSNNMSGLQFDVSNKTELLAQARKAAIADARQKAQLYATELGVKIKRLTSLSESGGYRPQPMMMRAAKMEMMSADVPVAEGSMQISISVNTSWELAN